MRMKSSGVRAASLCTLLLCGVSAHATAFDFQQDAAPARSPTDVQQVLPADPAVADPAIVDMDTVVVSGRQPGPGMWKVSKGDHVLYILGTLTPLPRRMEWVPDEVEATIARSQAVIDPPTVDIDADAGFFSKLFLIPSLLKARKNPDGRTLQEVVSPELYARWTVLKARYIGSSSSVETWRPVFAAQKLYESAIEKAGLSQKDVVQRAVRSAAKRADVPRISTAVTVKIKDPKAALRSFRETALADGDCFAKTMVRIDRDLDGMRARANAWAVGDVGALRDASFENQFVACTRAFTESALAERFGIGNLRTRIADTWLAAARDALAKNDVTFATLSIPLLLRPDGFLARLRKEGYAVEEPGASRRTDPSGSAAPEGTSQPEPAKTP